MSYQFPQMFDARTVEPSSIPPPVPAGDYPMVVIESEPKQTKDQTGGFLEFKMQIIQGQFQGRIVTARLNIFNQSAEAVRIAYAQLSALSHVTGVFNLQDTRQLHNIPFIGVVTVQAGGLFNDVRGFKDMQGNTPGKPPVGAPQAVVAAPPAPPANYPPTGYPGAPQAAPQPPQWPAQPAAAPPPPPPGPARMPWETAPPAAAPVYAPPQPPAAYIPPAAPPVFAAPPAAAPQPPQWQPGATPVAPKPPWEK